MKPSTLLIFIFFSVFIAFLSGCKSSPAKSSVDVVRDHRTTQSSAYNFSAEVIALHNLYKKQHYKRHDQRDVASLSAQIFVDKLDPTKELLLLSDERKIKSQWKTIYTQSMSGNLKPLFSLLKWFNNYKAVRIKWVNESVIHELETIWLEPSIEKIAERYLSVEQLDKHWKQELSYLYRQGIDNGYPKKIVLTGLEVSINHRFKNTEKFQFVQLFLDSIAKAHDPDSAYYLRNKQKQINMNLSLEGIGLVLRQENNQTKVVRSLDGGPSENLLYSGDIITEIYKDSGFVNVFGWPLDDVIKLMRGKSGTPVKLLVKGKDQKIRQLQVKREKVKIPEQHVELNVRKDKNKKIAIIKIPSFYLDYAAYNKGIVDYKSASRDVARTLNELNDVDVVLLDLRNNGGGAFLEAFKILDLFFEKQLPYLQVHDGDRLSIIQSRKEDNAYYKGKLAVLVNESSAGSSEIIAAAIQDYGRGVIFGRATYGLGVIGNYTQIYDGQTKITVSEYFRVNSDPIHLIGIVPDVVLNRSIPKYIKVQRDKTNNIITRKNLTALKPSANNHQ